MIFEDGATVCYKENRQLPARTVLLYDIKSILNIVGSVNLLFVLNIWTSVTSVNRYIVAVVLASAVCKYKSCFNAVKMFKTYKPMKIKTAVTPTTHKTNIVATIVKSVKKLFS